ncbi:hypothetical protein INR49_024675, partial [Caranx melampygus]
MQPPPRKVKESQQVKLVFSEQLSKLQTKHHQDTELLEEIRSFSKHRAAIEKEYGQTAASRLAAAEEYRRLAAQAFRSFRNAKDIQAKRGLEQLQKVQGEVVDALQELHTIKKSYHQLSHIANVAREKVADTQARARKSEHGIFHFKTGLQKMTTKLTIRLKECDDRLTEVRNEYLLALAAVNAHHHHYYTNSLPRILEQVDGNIYDDLRSHFLLLCGTELDTCMSTQKLYSNIWDSVAKVRVCVWCVCV